MKISDKNELIAVLYPDDIKCIVCGREIIPNRYGLCGECKFELNGNFCLRCGRHKVGIGDYCGECSDMPLYFDEARSAVSFTGAAKDAVHRLKYGDARYLARPMSEYLLDTLLETDWDIDCFTFVPMHKTRLKKRGYNQAQLLAATLAERTTTPCFELLEKHVATPNQARLDREERMKNVAKSFRTLMPPPEHVVIVDDVMTTGSTLSECAKTLKASGAKVVYALTFASVPERSPVDTPVQNLRDFRR